MESSTKQHAFLDQGGAMGERIRLRDWSGHPLGPVSNWAPALRTGLGIVLGSAFPAFLAWGEEQTLFFNDAYVPILGQKAEAALGMPYAAVWPEAWPGLAPYVRRGLEGESFFFEDYAVILERHGYPELAWFTFSFSPWSSCMAAASRRTAPGSATAAPSASPSGWPSARSTAPPRWRQRRRPRRTPDGRASWSSTTTSTPPSRSPRCCAPSAT